MMVMINLIVVSVVLECFNTMQVMTVTEMFAKHLIQIPGFSAEKAEAVIAQFPTPTRSIRS